MYYDERPSAMPPPGTFPILTRLLRRRSDSPQASRRKRDRQRNLAPFRNAGASIQASGQSQSSGELRPLEDAKASLGLWPVAAICATACQGLVGRFDPDRIPRAAFSVDVLLARQSSARLQSVVPRIPRAFLDLRRSVRRGTSRDLDCLAVVVLLHVLSDVRSGRPFLVRPADVGGNVCRPVRRARVFLSRIPGGGTQQVHRNLCRSGV